MTRLASVVTDIETVPEAHREFYEQKGEQWVLDADVEGHPSVGTLKETMRKERTRANELDKKLKSFGELTTEELEELRELRKREAERKEKGEKDEKEKPDLDALRKKWRKEFDDEVAPTRKELEELRAENRQLKLGDRVRAQAIASGIIGDDIDDVMLITKKYFDLDDDGNVVVLDEDGDPASRTLKEFWDEWFKKQKPKYYSGSGASGSGASGSKKGSGGSGSQEDLSKLPPAERIRVARERGITQ